MRVSDRFSLLDERLITIRAPGRRERQQVTLPELLSLLAQDGAVGDFPYLRAHQRHPWHSFLVQLAAIALHRANESGAEHSAERWRAMLLDSADGMASAFALVEPDLAKPAFLQPPVPEGTLAKWKRIETADALDILVTAKSHDVKAQRVIDASLETWMFALLSLQTMQGFLGAGNYGIARMNGGFASRPEVGLASSLTPSVRFRRDVRVLLDSRDAVTHKFGYSPKGGHALLWLLPWDGASALPLSECDAHFIEICRRIRFSEHSNVLQCEYKSTESARLEAKSRNGVVGDPWIPVDASGEKALTVSAKGLDYVLTQSLLWGSAYERPPALVVRQDDCFFIGRVLVRGQGKTEGFHERVLRIPPKVRSFLQRPDDTSILARISKDWLKHTSTLKLKVLKPALLTHERVPPHRAD
ncbi:MAG: type I-E CRISPR-associated protein Cse1/CasA, partial [Myxococcota bacterium]